MEGRGGALHHISNTAGCPSMAGGLMFSPCLRTSAVPAESQRAPRKKSSRVIHRWLSNEPRGIDRELSIWWSGSVCLASATGISPSTTSLCPRHGMYSRFFGPSIGELAPDEWFLSSSMARI